MDSSRLSPELLGQTLSRELVELIAASGANICGENGEYHTFVYYGPVFRRPVPFSTGPALTKGQYCLLSLSSG